MVSGWPLPVAMASPFQTACRRSADAGGYGRQWRPSFMKQHMSSRIACMGMAVLSVQP